MKVDSSSSANLPSPKNGVQGARQGDAAGAANGGVVSVAVTYTAGPSSGASGDANVNLSALSSHLRSLAASGSADIDAAQVESIKQAIKDGTLTVDTGKIADGILETARGLLQQRRPPDE
ncbi:MAG: negative regulator of flagellin synthesis FlgM [Paraburkholderia sp.]|nr:negative regulator of flagellin synthesis FlgM [Paraburkholderia sp.]